MHDETYGEHARRKTRHAFHTFKFWVADGVVGPVTGLLVGFAFGPVAGVIGGMFGAVALAGGVFGYNYVLAPHRQLSVLRRPAGPFAVGISAIGGVVVAKVTNHGAAASFEMAVDQYTGIVRRHDLDLAEPVRLPWLDVHEAFRGNMHDRTIRTILRSSSANSCILGLYAWKQTNPPHHLFQCVNANAHGGYELLAPANDDYPCIAFRITVATETDTPQELYASVLFIERRAVVLPFSRAEGRTPFDKAIDVLTSHQDREGRAVIQSIFHHRREYLPGISANGLSAELRASLTLAGVVSVERLPTAGHKGETIYFDRWRLNELGTDIIARLEASLRVADKEDSRSPAE